MPSFHADIIPLPGPLRRQIDRWHSAPSARSHLRFLLAAGRAGLVAADSVSWRIFKNPVSVFIGGVAAVVLEFGDPRVRDGVWQHSSFRTDPLTRLQRTGLAAMVTVYGPRSKAEA